MVFLAEPNPPLPTTRKRPNNGIAFTQSGKNELRTVCKACPEGIFTGDRTVWGRGRYLGLLHEACAARVGAESMPAATDSRPAAPKAATARPEPAPRPEFPRTGGILTPRQIPVVRRLAEGHTLAQVADIDHIGIGSVKNALHRARTRLGVPDNAALIEAARRHGLLRTADGSNA